MKPLNIAQIGAGHFGAYRRARLRETGLFRLLGAYDWNPDALQAAAREDGAQICRSEKELLALPDLEAVVISTGAKYHATQTVAALERGLHVFVEKPLCATPAELQDILDAQQRTGLVVACGHNDHAHSASSRAIQGRIEDGELGTIAAFECTTAHNGGLQIGPDDWRGDARKNPGGMLFQCGVHALHELMFFFGPPSHISAMMRFDVHTTQTADATLCQLRWPSGLVGTLNAYHVTPYRHTLSLYGTKASLFREEDPCFPTGVQLWQQTTHGDGRPEPKQLLELNENDTDACGNVRSFYRAVREGIEPSPSLRDGARAVALVFAAEEAARSSCTLELATLFPSLFARTDSKVQSISTVLRPVFL
jgi:predicted dehydrogenase